MMSFLKAVPSVTSRLLLVAIAILALGLSACGAGVYTYGVSHGDEFFLDDVYLRNGDRRGEYIYYNGDWFYHGRGTPYSLYWDFRYF